MKTRKLMGVSGLQQSQKAVQEFFVMQQSSKVSKRAS